MNENKILEVLIDMQSNMVSINTAIMSLSKEMAEQRKRLDTVCEEMAEHGRRMDSMCEEMAAQRKEIVEIKEEQKEMRKEFKRELKATERRIIDMHKKDLCALKNYIDIIAKEVQKHGKVLAV